jgi:hypothetical protein
MTNTTPQRRRTDVVSLVFGLLFLCVAGSWAMDHFLNLSWRLDWDLPHAGWILAGSLILVGILGILASLRQERVDAAPTVPDQGPDAPPSDTAP